MLTALCGDRGLLWALTLFDTVGYCFFTYRASMAMGFLGLGLCVHGQRFFLMGTRGQQRLRGPLPYVAVPVRLG
jgi:hypothetical protein